MPHNWHTLGKLAYYDISFHNIGLPSLHTLDKHNISNGEAADINYQNAEFLVRYNFTG
jgi:hypothetical protein